MKFLQIFTIFMIQVAICDLIGYNRYSSIIALSGKRQNSGQANIRDNLIRSYARTGNNEDLLAFLNQMRLKNLEELRNGRKSRYAVQKIRRNLYKRQFF